MMDKPKDYDVCGYFRWKMSDMYNELQIPNTRALRERRLPW